MIDIGPTLDEILTKNHLPQKLMDLGFPARVSNRLIHGALPRGGRQTVLDIAKVSTETLYEVGVADSEYLVADLPGRTCPHIFRSNTPIHRPNKPIFGRQYLRRLKRFFYQT
jgi:hypothetical protein